MSGFTEPVGDHVYPDLVEACNHNGGGFTTYRWPKPGLDRPVPKTGYARRSAPRDWYPVTSMYLDDVDDAVLKGALRWLAMTLGLSALASVAMIFVVRGVRRTLGGDIEQAVDSARQIANGDLTNPIQVHLNDGVSGDNYICRWRQLDLPVFDG